MEFRNLKKQYQELKPKIDAKIQEVLNDANFIMGSQVKALEKSLADYVGVKHCISCANGTDALSLLLMAWKIREGDAVFIPDFTFFSTGEVVAFQGAKPIFVDVDPDTFNIDVKKLEVEIKKVIQEGKYRPRAIIPVDLFGLPADYEALEILAQKYKLLLLEDAAQGFGGMLGERQACSFGDAATTSFFPAKPLGCYGDGGAIFTNDDALAALVSSYRVHGKGRDKYDNVRIGLNSRLDTIQAAILQVKFEAFKNYELEAVNQVAHWYDERLMDWVKIPKIPQNYRSSWAQYTIQLENEEQRNGLQEVLEKAGIPSMIYYEKPLHEQVAFLKDSSKEVSCAISQALCKTVLSLPMDPYLTEAEIDYVYQFIRKALL